jgi:hypothetical protein
MHDVHTALTTTPQSVVVLLEPSDRIRIDAEATQIIGLAQLPDEIASPAEEDGLNKALVEVDAWVKRERVSYDKVCSAAYDVWQLALENRRQRFARLETFVADARKLLGRYTARQDAIRRQEEQRLEEEERQRQLARQRAEAALLKKQGQPELAAAVMNTPVTAAPVRLPDVIPKRSGQSFRDEWKWRPKNGMAMTSLAKLIAREYVQVDEVKLNGIARSMKGSLQVEHVEFYCEKVLVRR